MKSRSEPRRKRNPCVYTGLVGARMRPLSFHNHKAPVQRAKVVLCGGPLDGQTVQLELNGDYNTLPIILRGQTGVYRCGKWQPL
jgi:hypothetical protein